MYLSTYTSTHTFSRINETRQTVNPEKESPITRRKRTPNSHKEGGGERERKRDLTKIEWQGKKLRFAGQTRLNAWYYVDWWMPLVNFIISATSLWLAVWANRFYAARHGQNWKSWEDEMIKKERKNEREEGKHYESEEGWKNVKKGWRKERQKEKMEKKAEKSDYDWSLESPQILPQIYVELKVTKGKDKERKKKKRRSKRARKNKKRGGKKGEKGRKKGRVKKKGEEESLRMIGHWSHPWRWVLI